MLKIIKHVNTVHTYKCGRCGCIFIADNSEIKDGNILMQCPECKFYILEHDSIDDRAIIKDKLFEKVNVPSCWKVGEHDKKYEATDTFATIDSSKKDGFTFGTTFDEYK